MGSSRERVSLNILMAIITMVNGLIIKRTAKANFFMPSRMRPMMGSGSIIKSTDKELQPMPMEMCMWGNSKIIQKMERGS